MPSFNINDFFFSLSERENEFMIRKKYDNRGDLYGKEMNPVVCKRLLFIVN